MPCVNANGEITEMAKRILLAMVQGSSLDKVAEQTGTPLYRIRMAARELVEAGFAEQKAQSFVTTEAGLAALSKGATKSKSLGNDA